LENHGYIYDWFPKDKIRKGFKLAEFFTVNSKGEVVEVYFVHCEEEEKYLPIADNYTFCFIGNLKKFKDKEKLVLCTKKLYPYVVPKKMD